jgi:long-chain acyl-CoA synthetase
LMRESPYIAQIMVVGENRKFPGALIVPAFKNLIEDFEGRGVHLGSDAEIAASGEVKALIESEILRLNRRLGRFAQIKKFSLLSDDWSVAGGDLTPTLKLKRKQLLKKYAREIESLYSGEKRTESASEIKEPSHLPATISQARERNHV